MDLAKQTSLSTNTRNRLIMRIVVCTPGFNTNSGGSLVLDVIAHKLLEAGLRVAFLMLAPVWLDRERWTFGLATEKLETKILRGIPVIDKAELNQISDIVIYPEVVYGNPCGASKVIRWLLNSPGKICATRIDFAKEMIISHATHFIPKEAKNIDVAVLSLTYIDWDLIETSSSKPKQRNVSVVVRKGRRYHQKIPTLPRDWLILDGFPFERQVTEMAKSNYVISFDPYTMLSNYACLVGSKSIVVPIPEYCEDQWLPEVGRRTGIAYGISASHEICWESQRRQLTNIYESCEEQNTKLISILLELIYARFA